MRTTLTIDDDVAVRLEQLKRERNASLKEIVNEVLRRGLDSEARPKARKPFRLKTFDGGELLIPIDNVAEAISLIEGDNHK